jgi:LysR family transcriptional regulator, hypochlorite-specific transcription factor HypT
MDLEWLQSYVRLAQTGSFSRSAEDSNVTQPAFSRRIKALEAWLGVPLVDRSTYPTKLTASGREFLQVAEEVVRALHVVRRNLSDSRRRETNIINIAALHTLSLTFFPSWIAELDADIRRLSYRLMSDNLHDCVQAMVEGSCDLLLCYTRAAKPLELDPGRFPSILLGNEIVIPVSAPRNARKPLFALPGRQEQPVPMLAYSPNSFLGSELDKMLGESERPHHFRCIYENSFAEALKAMAVAGFGLTWLPTKSIEGELATGRLLRAGPESWDLKLEIRLFRAVDRTRPAVDRLWEAASAKSQAQGPVGDYA